MCVLLSANNFTGTIPDTFGNLKNLTDLIDGSELSGKIPSFIGNWTNIERLRISDLNGSGSTFPNLQDMNNLTVL
ncbi:hypothetical protein DKX38_017611 [Salix brachista]|uniref:Leucine-rich repeat-containing N-terminal plant-type domain-containing protein n=1 Tax=Salix brachista TaxID=2182728 RepID=A0A5N5KVQ3_9ROSI|nr:hypothetical protein DKX38_017611 [Salix brachista]